MKKTDESFGRDEGETAVHVLRQFVAFFEYKGWLNRSLVIRRQGARYRVCCTEGEFLAYRINDKPGHSPGIPGWPVCAVNCETIFHDSETCPFPSDEPSPQEWLRSMVDGDFEVM